MGIENGTMMKTIAQIIHQNNFPLELRDLNDSMIYYENGSRHWYKCRYDSDGKEVYYENFEGRIEED